MDPTLEGQLHTSVHSQLSWLVLVASHAGALVPHICAHAVAMACNSQHALVGGWSHSPTCFQQLQYNHNWRAHVVHAEGSLGAPGCVDQGDYATRHTGHFLHIATLPRLGDIADIPDT